MLSFTPAGRMVEGLRVELDPGSPPDLTYEQVKEWANLTESGFYKRKRRQRTSVGVGQPPTVLDSGSSFVSV